MEAFKQHGFALDDGFIPPDALFALFGQPFQLALDGDQVVQDEFAVHGRQVAGRVDAAVRVRDIVIFKTAHHLDKAVHLRQLVEQCAGDAGLAGAAIQPGDIRIGHLGVDGLFGFEHFGEAIHPRIGHIHHARCVLPSCPADMPVGWVPRVSALNRVVLPD